MIAFNAREMLFSVCIWKFVTTFSTLNYELAYDLHLVLIEL